MSSRALPGRRRITLLTLALLAAVLGLRTLPALPVSAILQTTDVCGSSGSTPFAVGAGIVECDYKTLAVIPTDPPGVLTLQIRSPIGMQFTGTGTLPNSLPFGCSSQVSTLVMPNDFVSISCAVGTAGLPKNSTVALLLQTPAAIGPDGGQVLMDAGYLTRDPNDMTGQHLLHLRQCPSTFGGTTQCADGTPADFSFPPFAYQFDAFSGPIVQYANPPGPVTPAHEAYLTTISATNPLLQSSIVCVDLTNPVPPPLPSLGDTISCTVTYPGPGNTPSFISVVPSAGVTLNPGPTGSTRPPPDSSGFLCGSITTVPLPPNEPPQIPSPVFTETPCTTFTFTAVVNAAGTPQFTIRSFALGAAQPYDAPTLSSGILFGGSGSLPVGQSLAKPQTCGALDKQPVANTFTFQCDYVTQAPVAPTGAMAATLAITVTAPAAGVTFAATPVSTAAGPFNCTSSAGGTPTVTITCAAGAQTIPTGTVLQLHLTSASATDAQLAFSATYTNPPNPPISPIVPPFQYQFDAWAGNASNTHFNGEASPTAVTCFNTNPAKAITTQVIVGDTFTCGVDYPANQTPTFATVTSANGAATIGMGTVTTTRPAPNSVGYPCDNNTPAPLPVAAPVPPATPPAAPPPTPPQACVRFYFTGTAGATGNGQFIITSFGLGAAMPYDTSTVSAVLGIGGPPFVVGPPAGVGFGPALAKPQTCGALDFQAVANTFTFQCDYPTQAPIAPNAPASGSLSITVTAPLVGVTFTPANPVTTTGGLFGCTVSGGGTSTVTITCSPGAGTIPAGTVLQLHLTSASATDVQLAFSATYTSPPLTTTGPVPPFDYQFDAWAGKASNTHFNGEAAPVGVTCFNTNAAKTFTAPLTVGDPFTCAVDYPLNTASFVVVTSATGNGAATVAAGTVASTRPAPNNIGYPCDANNPPALPTVGNPTVPPATQPPVPPPTPPQACNRFYFTGMAASPGTPKFTIASYALGAAVPYNSSTLTALLGTGGPIFVIGAPTGPLFAALGCANGTQPTDIAFPALPNMTLAGQTQFATIPPLSPTSSVPAVLSVITPNVAVICGAVFEDAGSLATDKDANPLTIDGGTITYTVSGGIAVIAETSTTTDTINCGTSTPPTGFESCAGAEFNNGSTSIPLVPPFLSPNPSNIIHVALQPGVAFGFLGGGSPVVTLTATYTRYPTLNGGGPAKTLTTNPVNIPVTLPPYEMTLTPSVGAIPAASGLPSGSTITAALFHPAVIGCQPLLLGGFVACSGNPLAFGFGAVPAVEGGLVTFTTDAGVLAGPNDPSGSSAQLQFTVHCGPIPTSPPVILVPSFGVTANFLTAQSLTTCVSISAVLYGADAPGNAHLTATFVGDITGATTQAVATVVLSTAPPALPLTRGCNEVITGTGTPAGTPISQIAGQVIPSNVVVSIWQFNNSTHGWNAGYFSTPGAPTDMTTTGPTQSLFICVTGSGIFQP